MATYSRILLSGSTNGKPIKLTTLVTAGAPTIHTAVSGTSSFDEIYLWASNTSAAAATLTIEWGGTTSPDDLICALVSIPANSPPIPIVTGEVLNNGLLVRAFAGTINVINITGFVNRIV